MRIDMNKVLITGGAGFIGSNLARYILENDYVNKVVIYDNLSRVGVEKNLEWLRRCYGNRLDVKIDDVRNYEKLKEVMKDIDVIYHCAAQTAVTTSIINPREDFEINALGTLRVLEAAKNAKTDPILAFTSTNKVYGETENVEIVERDMRYDYKHLKEGISESQPLDFYSPYGCSKGAADQYVRDYYRIYDLKTVVFRMSCIYGPGQFGNEDQGWVAHFIISAVMDRPLMIYGDGKQVRDILFVEDLCKAFVLATENISKTKGKVYNIGGGRENTISLLELLSYLGELLKNKIEYSFDNWRHGDQRVYYSDISKAKKDFGWIPRISKEDGIVKLFNWIVENKSLF